MANKPLNKVTQLPEYGIADITGLQTALSDITDSLPPVVQGVGPSTTDVMSQNAATEMVYSDINPTMPFPQNRYGISVGFDNKIGHANNIAIGHEVQATSTILPSIAIGTYAGYASNDPGASILAIGYNTKAGHLAVAIGNQVQAIGTSSVAINGTTYAAGGITIGRNASVGADATSGWVAEGGIAIGNGSSVAKTMATANGSIAIGGYTTASVAGDEAVLADKNHSIALGVGSKTGRPGELSVGNVNTTSTTSPVWKTRFIANVRDPELPQDAATKAYVDSQGGPAPVQTTGDSTTDVMSQKATTDMVYLPKSTGQDYSRISIGKESSSAVDVGNIININAGAAPSPNAQAANSILISSNLRDSTQPSNIPRVIGEYGVAINGRVDAESGIAIGSGISVARANGTNSVAIGLAASAATALGTAIGANSAVASTAANSTAIGGGASVTVDSGTAIGTHANVTGANGVALGRNAKSTSSRSVAIGAQSETFRNDEVSFGNLNYGTTVAYGARYLANVRDPERDQDAATKKYVDAGTSYSTSETRTGGLWINGRPIYRQVVTINTLPNSSIQAFPHGITGIDMILNVYGCIFVKDTGAPAGILNALQTQPISDAVGATAGRANISIATSSDRSALGANVVLEYTKQ